MQVIKRITIPETSDETSISRPVRYPTSKTYVYEDVTDFINGEVATFLSECGVDAFYGVREGFGNHKWLWIRGVPSFFYVSTAFNFIYQYPGSSSITTISQTASAPFVLSFVGNPKKTFIFRVFSQSFDFLFGMLFRYLVSLASGKQYPTTSGVTSDASISTVGAMQHTLTEETIATTKLTFGNRIYREEPFYISDIGEGIVLIPLMPSSPDTLAPRVLVDGEYEIPQPLTSEVTNVPLEDIYQTEIDISGRKFLIGYNSQDHDLGGGLIALEDDDPLISEDDLMAEVET